ncbi:subtilisin serine protease pr1c [Pyrenophora teres f. maculata]|nr:subtilisin serine protease pr1c [Pyrenophora teres f. maculata]
MLSSNFRVTALLASLAVSTVAALNSSPQAPPNYLPRAYIVEFRDTDADKFSATCDAFYKNLTSCSIAAHPRLDLNHELFLGASFRLGDGHDGEDTLNLIKSFSSVKQIWPVKVVSRPVTKVTEVPFGYGYTQSTPQHAHQKRGIQDAYIPHVMGGVDKLHAQNITGKGVFIGLIDSGVDFMHPVLGGGFGPGFKITAGEDIVGNAFTGFNTPIPGGKPMDCFGHGTLLSGIIGAKPNPFGFTGVAPDATLGMWKASGCNGDPSTDVVIRALNLAYEAGVDIISLSFGHESGWSEDVQSVAIQPISEKGIPVVVAAGNNGTVGLFDAEAPANSVGALAVTSTSNYVTPMLWNNVTYTTNGANPTSFGCLRSAIQNISFDNTPLPLYALDYNRNVSDTACTPLPDSTPDLGGYITLVQASTYLNRCNLDQQLKNLGAKGAKRVFFHLRNPKTLAPWVNSTTIAVVMIPQMEAQHFLDLLQAGKQVNATVTGAMYATNNNYTNKKQISEFSSWGPTYELFMKPEVAAPGGDIISTSPLNMGGYRVASGTSLSAPYIAGTIALLMQAKGKKFATPSEIYNLLTTTADPLQWIAPNSTFLAPVMQQGGGGVNAYKAAFTTTTVDARYIGLNDTAHFTSVHVINIKNIFKQAQTYTFDNLKAPTVYTFSNGSHWPDEYEPTQGRFLEFDHTSQASASIRFEPETLTVEAGSIGKLTMHFTPPKGLDASRLPLYNGYVAINGSSGDSLTVPYMGASANMIDQELFDKALDYPYLARSTNVSERLNGSDVFPLPIDYKLRNQNTSYPTVMCQFAMGSRVVTVDIASKAKNSTTIQLGNSTNDGDHMLGLLPDMPVLNQDRGEAFNYTWNGTLADGQTPVPAGTYRLIFRALKILGNQNDDADYEKWVSPYFDLKYY